MMIAGIGEMRNQDVTYTQKKGTEQVAVKYQAVSGKEGSLEGAVLVISEEAREQMEKMQEGDTGEERRAQEAAEAAQLQWLKDMAEQIRTNDEEGRKNVQVQTKCMKIAMRLVAGDKVPYQDERFLQKNDPDLYMRSLKMRVPKQDPKEYDSVLDEEDRESMKETTFQEEPFPAGRESSGIGVAVSSER